MTITEEELRMLIKKQSELEAKMKELEKELIETKTDVKNLKEDISVQYMEIKGMFTDINTEIKQMTEKIIKSEVLNEVQEEKINGSINYIMGMNTTMFKFLIYLTGFSLSGLFGFKLIEFIQNLF